MVGVVVPLQKCVFCCFVAEYEVVIVVLVEGHFDCSEQAVIVLSDWCESGKCDIGSGVSNCGSFSVPSPGLVLVS